MSDIIVAEKHLFASFLVNSIWPHSLKFLYVRIKNFYILLTHGKQNKPQTHKPKIILFIFIIQ